MLVGPGDVPASRYGRRIPTAYEEDVQKWLGNDVRGDVTTWFTKNEGDPRQCKYVSGLTRRGGPGYRLSEGAPDPQANGAVCELIMPERFIQILYLGLKPARSFGTRSFSDW